MRLNRVKIVVLCLGLALLVMTGSAMAGTTTTSVPGPFKFAREVAVANALYNFPGWVGGGCPNSTSFLYHQMNVIRTFNATGTPQNYFVDVILDPASGAKFTTVADNGANPINPATGFTVTNEPTINIYRIVDSANGFGALPNNKVRYYIQIQGSEISALPIINIPLALFQVRDVNNVIGAGGTINVTVSTTDASSGVGFDNTPDDSTAAASPGGFMTGGGFGVAINNALVPGHATLDIFTNRTNFVVDAPHSVTTTSDGSATIAINNAVSGVLRSDGCPYGLTALSSIQLQIYGNFTDVTQISYGTFTYNGPFNTNPVNILIPGNNGNFNGSTQHITITVSGTSVLSPQIWGIAINEFLGGSPDGPPVNSRSLLPATTLTTWTLNGTILTAIFQNGNNAAFMGRLYLWNPSNMLGQITASVYTLPTTCAAAGTCPPGAVPAPSTLIGSVVLDPAVYPGYGVPGPGGLNVRVYEDILAHIPANMDPKVMWSGTGPYTFNGGNIVVVLSISAPNVVGWSNVFNTAFSFGIEAMVVTVPNGIIF